MNSWTQWGAAAYGSDGYGAYGQSSSAYGATTADYSKDDSAAAGFGPATGSSYQVGGSYGTSFAAANFGNGSSSSTPKFTPMSATTNVYSSTINSLKAKANPTDDTSGHYAGYESAVYTAASNYIQGKRAGLHGKANGSGGGAAAQQRYCEICNVTCAGDIPMKAHLEGKQHKEKANLAASGGPDLRTRQVSMRCEACNVTCTGRDAYTAHAQGAKHQKVSTSSVMTRLVTSFQTVALLRRMGKHVPTDPTLMPPTTGTLIPPAAPKKVVGITGTNFVRAGETRLSTAIGTIGPQQPPQQPPSNANVPPIGEEYVEVRNTGAKVTQYHCKLCDCPLGDSVAKMAHLTGRRHRLQYKQKVNPSLQVEPRPHEQRYPKPGQVRPGDPVPLAAVGSAPQL
ncbi:DZF family protein [Aphelenchoides avenae]|nr:DZF family protein [Aphelenchus avenae]